MKNIFNYIMGGLNNVLLFCAVWMGVILVGFILISNETSPVLKIGTTILIFLAFMFGYFDKRKELKAEKSGD